MKIDEINSKLMFMSDLTDLSLLKERIIFSDEFADLPKSRQDEIYTYCKCNAAHEACKENLNQIRYAVAKVYFGF